MPSCSVCGQETDLHVNGEPTCPECDKPVIGKESRSFEELNEALTLAAQEYFDALDNHSKSGRLFRFTGPWKSGCHGSR